KDIIQKKIESYVKEYVLCKECGKPDTKLIKEGRITFLKCEACGAKSSVKSIK
ncbi:MAG: translation initiation factor IF-2 subunit beta, partial [Promethearchaeota archaeon]